MIKEITASRFFAESLGVYFPYSENESCLHLLYDFGEINSPSYIVFIVLNLRYFPRKFCLDFIQNSKNKYQGSMKINQASNLKINKMKKQ
jgi:hypothetical protein